MLACSRCLDPRPTMMTYSSKQEPKPPRVQRSPWMISSSKFLTSRFSNTNNTNNKPTTTTTTTLLKNTTSSSSQPPVAASSAHDKLPELQTKESSTSRHSEPVRKHKSPDYIPKLTKYRLENPDRFQKLSKSPQRSKKENSSAGLLPREVSPMRSSGLLPQEVSPMRSSGNELGLPKWQQQQSMSREYGLQQAINESRNLQLSSHTSPKCSAKKSSNNNMNVTLMDIANLSPTAFDRSAPTKISDLLFNTFVDVQRFRRLLRDDDGGDATTLTTKNVQQRVNFCDAEKTRRIAAWLSEVDEEMKMNRICEETIEQNIVYEDNSSKWNVRDKL